MFAHSRLSDLIGQVLAHFDNIHLFGLHMARWCIAYDALFRLQNRRPPNNGPIRLLGIHSTLFYSSTCAYNLAEKRLSAKAIPQGTRCKLSQTSGQATLSQFDIRQIYRYSSALRRQT